MNENKAIEKEKSTITVDENDLIIYAKKIEKNNSEDKSFEIKVNDFISGKLSPNEVLKIGTTPNCLRAAGAKAIPLVITQSVLSNSMEAIEASKTASKKHSEQHDIQIDIIKSLPKLLRNPIMINKGNQPDTVVLISEAKNKEGQNIVVPMILNVKGQNSRVNRITTIHGKKNIENYLNKAVVNNSIIAVNKTKADKLFSDIGIQSPKSTTIICFDNSIAYSMQNVKMPKEIVLQNTTEKENPMKNAEMSMEQNYNSIDGIINNLPIDTDVPERTADVPPEHSVPEQEYDEIVPEIAAMLDISVSQVEALPNELKELAAVAYINNADMPEDELKDMISEMLELTPQAADITDVKKEAQEIAMTMTLQEKKEFLNKTEDMLYEPSELDIALNDVLTAELHESLVHSHTNERAAERPSENLFSRASQRSFADRAAAVNEDKSKEIGSRSKDSEISL